MGLRQYGQTELASLSGHGPRVGAWRAMATACFLAMSVMFLVASLLHRAHMSRGFPPFFRGTR
jgi:hypothetical protein